MRSVRSQSSGGDHLSLLYAFTGRDALRSKVSAIDDSRDNSTTGKKKALPARVAQEGFMAESVYRRGQTDVKVSPRFRRQRDE